MWSVAVVSGICRKKTIVILSDNTTRSFSVPIYLQVFFILLLAGVAFYLAYTKIDRNSLVANLGKQRNRAEYLESKNKVLMGTVQEMDRIVGISLNYLEKVDGLDKVYELRKMARDAGVNATEAMSEDSETEHHVGYTKRIANDIRRKIDSAERLLSMFNIRSDSIQAVDGEGIGGGEGGAFIPMPVQYKDAKQEKAKPISDKVSELERQISKLASLKNVTRNLPIGAPLKYTRVSSKFGKRIDPFVKKVAMHNGIDLVAPLNTIIRATGGGKITQAGSMGSYGNAVIIDHGNNIKTLYAHMKSVKVKKGQRVRKGDTLGIIGNTGRSSGTHLHYQVEINGKAVNPEKFMNTNSF